MDPHTADILAWARRSAVANERSALSCEDLLCGVYATADQPPVHNVLGEIVGDRISWPDDLVALHARARDADPVEHKLPLDPRLKAVVDAAYAEDHALAPRPLLRHLLNDAEGLIARFVEVNRGGRLVRALEERFQRTRALMDAASGVVEGQEAAIAMLGDAFLRASLGATPAGPRGIFTFLGPPGVGKTLLAETFAAHLTRERDAEPYVFRRFDMSTFAGHQNHEQLFGTEGFYKDARPGTLTGFVKEHPRAVILFDEIEKAHDNVIQSLLAVLDKGEVVDKNLDQPVNFGQTWLVFTSNLGREFFDESNQSGFLHTLDHAPGMVFEILGSARRRGQEEAAAALAPEFVSRLAKGGAVVFRALETRHHLALMERAIRSQIATGRTRSGIDLPELKLAPEVKLLLLLSLLPTLDARKVVSRSETWAIDVVGRAYRALREVLADARPDDFSIRIEPSEAATAFLDARRPAPIRLLLIDEDDYLPPVLEALQPAVSVRRVSRRSEVGEALRRFEPDLVLLDLTLEVPAGSAEVEPALRILEDLRTTERQLPVYLFSENPAERESFDQVLRAVLDRGGARGFIPCDRPPDRPLDLGAFAARVQACVEELATARLLDRERRSNRTVSWDLSFRYLPDERVVVAEVGPPRAVVAYSAADPGSPIRFRGIPSARFSDVVGLERAKRRLASVLDGLREPSKLAAFGASPPRGLLLAGPPGTGKTLLAHALAGEAGLPFLALSAGELRSKWVGESEARIRELFARARQYAPTIVFIDEIDGLGRARPEAAAHEASVLNQLLAELDGAASQRSLGLVLAATNHPEVLDKALLRPGRFDEIIPMDLPNLAARRAFFEGRLASVPTEGEIDLDGLARATGGASPAELDRVVREAIYHAAEQDRAGVTADDLHRARRLVRFGAEARDTVLAPDDRRMTAYHEAGHALCFLLRFPERTIDHLTIIPNERGALGFLAPAHEEGRHSLTVEEVRAELVVALAGREAERLVGGGDRMTSGVSSDLAHATSLVSSAIGRWGFDAQLGPVSLDALPEPARARWGERTAARLGAWLAEAEREAAADLDRHRDLLDRIATALLERESLDWDDLERLRPPAADLSEAPAAR